MSREESDSGINWDDVEDLAGGGGGSAAPADIPDDVQDKLLSDYERELITEKVKKGENGSKKKKEEETLEQEMTKTKKEAKKKEEDKSRSSPGSSEKGKSHIFWSSF